MQEGEGSIQVEWFSKHRQRNLGVGRRGGLGARVWELETQENTGKEWQFSNN